MFADATFYLAGQAGVWVDNGVCSSSRTSDSTARSGDHNRRPGSERSNAGVIPGLASALLGRRDSVKFAKEN